MGRIFVTSQISPGALYRINPSLAPGALTTVATNLGSNASGIAFDGARVWTRQRQLGFHRDSGSDASLDCHNGDNGFQPHDDGRAL